MKFQFEFQMKKKKKNTRPRERIKFNVQFQSHKYCRTKKHHTGESLLYAKDEFLMRILKRDETLMKKITALFFLPTGSRMRFAGISISL